MFPEPVEIIDGGRVIRQPQELMQEPLVNFFRFSRGDPLGDWKLQVFVNDACARSIRFKVVTPAKERAL